MLYLLAVGGVRGFAFTLGLTTVIDLVVVFLFTQPAGHPARAGRGSSPTGTGCPASTPSTSASARTGRGRGPAPPLARHRTIAERRAAEAAATGTDVVDAEADPTRTARRVADLTKGPDAA